MHGFHGLGALWGCFALERSINSLSKSLTLLLYTTTHAVSDPQENGLLGLQRNAKHVNLMKA